MDWAPPVPAGYNDANRAFLQAFMSRGALTLADAQPILAAIISAQRQRRQTGEGEGEGRDNRGGNRVANRGARGEEEEEEEEEDQQQEEEGEINPDDVTQQLFDRYVRTAREVLLPLDYDIRSTTHQATQQRVWALINAHSDPATQLATSHSAEEIAFVKRLLDAMFDTYNTPRMEVMAVTEAQAYKVARPAKPGGSGNGRGGRASGGAAVASGSGAGEASQQQQTTTSGDKGLKHSEVIALLPQLVAEGWLDKSREGFYTLSARALVELWAWLQETYNDPDPDADGSRQRIKSCVACMEVVTMGQRCADRDCLVRLHNICQDTYWRSRRDKNCPKCGKEWTGRHFVGEKAVTTTDAYQRSKGGGRRSNVRPSDLVDSIIEQQEEEDDDAMEE